MMNRLLMALLCLSLLTPSFQAHAEVMGAEDAVLVESFEQQVSESISLERLQNSIDIVRAEATSEEEIEVIDSIQNEVNELKAEHSGEKPKKQTKIGRLASKIGLALNRGMMKAMTPFFYGTAYLSGRFEKKKRLNDQTDSKMINLIARIGNALRSKGEIAAAEITDRILRGDKVSMAEIDLLVTAFPKLDVKTWEGIASVVGFGVAAGTTVKILTLAGFGAASTLYAVTLLGWYSSTVPCMFSDLSENPNANLVKYCDQQLEDSYTIIMKSRIRGYLRGIKDRNNAERL